MKPILLDLPEHFETNRLTIRAPRSGDGRMVHAMYVEAGDRIHRWVPFANPKLTVDEVEETARRWHASFLTREMLAFQLFLKGTDTLVGQIALHDIEWSVPKFEMGYLVRPSFERQGLCHEAVEWLTRLAFECLDARRVEIQCDARNEPSQRVAERAGFTLEGTLHQCRRDEWDGSLLDRRVYAKVRPDS